MAHYKKTTLITAADGSATPRALTDVRWAMVVTDGRRVVGKAKKVPLSGEWLCQIYGGCWADAMTDEKRIAHFKRTGIRLGFGTNLKVVATKAQARKLIMSLVT